MSSPHSNLDKMREYFASSAAWSDGDETAAPRRPVWPALLIGAAMGLALGLLIGWVFWPVQWTNAVPPDLSQEAKADYLSSVADAYVAARNQQAVELAAFRLRHFGDPQQITDEIAATQAWLADAEVRDAGLRINNLNELADALQLGLVVQQPESNAAATGTQSDTEEFDITSVTEDPEPVEGDWGWARWLLIMAAGLLLIVAGFLVLRRLWMPVGTFTNVDEGEEAYGFEDEELPGRDDLDDDAPTSLVYDKGDGFVSADTDPADSYAFDEEAAEATSAGTMTVALREDADAYVADAHGQTAEEGAFAEEEAWTEDVWHADAAARTTEEDARLHPGIGSDEDDLDDGVETNAEAGTEAGTEEDVDSFTPQTPTDMTPVATTGAAARDASPPRAHVKPLGKYRVRYDHGDPDYDESFNILDAESGTYIGECGMGVNMKSGILQNNPEHVVALDVWLFDKTDERRLETKTVILTSPTMIEQDTAKIFGGDREGVQLLAPEKDLHFELEGGHLVLDCVVKQVDYLDAGVDEESRNSIFRTMALDMTVRRRR